MKVLVNGRIKQLSLIDRVTNVDYIADFMSIGEHQEWMLEEDEEATGADIKLAGSEFEWWADIISKQQWINDNTVNADGGYVNLLGQATSEELEDYENAFDGSSDLEDTVNSTYDVLQRIATRMEEDK